MTILTCYYCGSENPDSVFHCTQCGAPLKHGHPDLGRLPFARYYAAPGVQTAQIFGIDISHWDGVIDWQTIKAANVVKFCIAKATEGESFVDSKFAANKAGCQSIGMPWSSYHFFRPAEDPITQARHFYQTVGDGCHVYIVDVEIPGENLAARARTCAEELKRLGAPVVMIYTGPYFWNTNVGNVPWAAAYDLWIANYEVNQPAIPPPWTTYRIWQYSDKGSIAGINAAVDMNWFNGDINGMYDYFKNGNEVPEPPPLPDVVRNVAKDAYGNPCSLMIRATPNGVLVGKMPPGFEVHLTGSGLDGSGRLWYKSGAGYFASYYTEPV